VSNEPPRQVEVLINGERRRVRAEATVLELLRELEIDPARVAIEFNREILRREHWGATRLRGGEQIEIVQFVGGG
jgi:thiamine biosynthesis protein ThiS